MAPLIVFTVVFGTGFALRAAHVRHFRDWGTALRYALAAMFLLTAWAHFGSLRAELVRMVPPFFPNPEFLVTFTGVAEILGAIGLLIPRFATAAAVGLTLLLLAIFPANVYAALNELTLGGKPVTELLPRALMQVVFLAATITAARHSRYVRTPGASWPVSSTYSR
ncbi:MAG TPA: DoxX family protein [Polyangiaceae bacterium]